MLKDHYDSESEENGQPPKFFHTKHFLNFLWNTPRWFVEDLYYKYYQKPKEEVQRLKLDNELLKAELAYTKIFLQTANETKRKT